jgi:hypothetical protein
MKSPQSLAFFLASAMMSLSALPADAQTCPTTPATPTITALSHFERTLTLASNVLSTIAPNIAADMLAGINSGALELREQLNFNAQDNVLTEFYFTVQAGAPTPTNLAQIPFSSIFATSTLSVCQIVVGTKPSPSAMFFGTIANSSPSFFGPSTGEPAVFSFGYTNDTPPQINNVTDLIAGIVVAYSPSATGSFTVFPPPGGPSGGSGSITISVIGPGGSMSPTNTFTTTGGFAALDASASTSSNGGPLTFSWAPLPGSIVGITGGTSSAVLQLNGLRGGHSYQIMLTVTDSKGVTATAIVTVIDA